MKRNILDEWLKPCTFWPLRSRSRYLAILVVFLGLAACANTEDGASHPESVKGRTIVCRSPYNKPWMFRIQEPSGAWAGGEDPNDGRVCTALVILVAALAGESDVAGSFKYQLSRALNYLISKQGPDGFVGSKRSKAGLYQHAAATLAMSEMLRNNPQNQGLRQSLEKAIGFISRRQLPCGLWSLKPEGQDPDAYTSAWVLMGAWSAAKVNVAVDEIERKRALDALATLLKSAEKRPSEFSICSEETVIAAVKVARRLHKEPIVFNASQPPNSDQLLSKVVSGGVIQDCYLDPAFWFFEYTARKLAGESNSIDEFSRFAKSVVEPALAELDDLNRTWTPLANWARLGGRTYVMAFGDLTLEAHYNYPRMLGVQ